MTQTTQVLDERTGIYITPAADDALNEFAWSTYRKSLLRKDENSPQLGLARAARAWCGGDMDLAQRIYDYSAKKWFMWATPTIANAPLPNEVLKKMPISCFLTYVPDTVEGLKSHIDEVITLTTGGGGIGSHWSDVRPADEKSRGIVPHMVVFNTLMEAYAQSEKGRRGSIATHVHCRHADLMEFVGIRLPTQGDPLRKCFGNGFHHAVILNDAFMNAVLNDQVWQMYNHKDQPVISYKARDIWYAILDARMKKGEPYICFEENVNKWFPEAQKKLGLKFNGSNLCVAPETTLLTDQGNKVISEIVGQPVMAWNGKEWSRVIPEKTGESQKLLKVTLTDVADRKKELNVTDYHTWHITRKVAGESQDMAVKTVDLVVGDHVIFELPIVDGQNGVIGLRRMWYTVRSVEDEGRVDDTYCVNEEKFNTVVFNDVLTGNCNEITLATSEDRTAVCCLSSLNLDLIHEWWNTPIVEDMLTVLDNMISYFIEKAPAGYERSVYSAFRERAVGLGTMGFHTLLQRRNIAFESETARTFNVKIFKEIRKRADAIDLKLGAERGEAPDMIGTGRRFSHKLAIAPNATSANGVGVSPGVEPINGNIFSQVVTSGVFSVENQNLKKLLKKYGHDDRATWESIAINKGSVQQLDFLSEYEKEVYKTARELDQRWIIRHAADRVPFVCQSQSINLFPWPDADASYISDVHILAWRLGMKGLYYLRSRRLEDVNASTKVTRAVLPDRADFVEADEEEKMQKSSARMVVEESACVACEG